MTATKASPATADLKAFDAHQARLENWRQTPRNAVPDAATAEKLINAVGLATVYPCSVEVADLFHAHVGDPDAKTEMQWDSPSGVVYSWRWEIGKAGGAFYAQVVRKRPTFVSWPLVPAILKLVGDARTPDELFDFGVISGDAYKIAQALEGSESPLGTGDIRKAAGFPTGRDHSARYHKALAELDHRLLITTEFGEGDLDGSKRHGLMFERRRADVDSAQKLTVDEAIDALLAAYLPAATYILPTVLAKQLRIQAAAMISGVDMLVNRGRLEETAAPGLKGPVYRLAKGAPKA